jgi:hypothetical protein
LKRKRSATDQNADEDIEEASAGGGLQVPSSRSNRGNRRYVIADFVAFKIIS